MQDETYRLIPLRARDGSVRAYAMVDAADFGWLSERRWSLHSGGYAQHGATIAGKRVCLTMHRYILGLEFGDPREGDHRNGKRLDNRRANLRIVPRSGNAQNRTVARGSSIYVGVSRRPEYGTWQATAKLNGHHHNLGDYLTEIDAAAAAAQFRHVRMEYAVEDQALLAHAIPAGSRQTRILAIERADEIVRRWHAGESLSEIAEALGFTRNALGSMMTRLRAADYDLPHRNPVVARARSKSTQER